jgi:hypothetical protein
MQLSSEVERGRQLDAREKREAGPMVNSCATSTSSWPSVLARHGRQACQAGPIRVNREDLVEGSSCASGRRAERHEIHTRSVGRP